jgi:hypothetical protein
VIGSACALAMVANRKVTIAKSRSSLWGETCRDLCMTIVKNPLYGNVTPEERPEWAPQACYAPVLVAVNAIL